MTSPLIALYYTCMYYAGCRSCEQRLKSCDDAFRHQLEAKQKAHDSHMITVMAKKDQEIAQAHQRVSQCSLLSRQA